MEPLFSESDKINMLETKISGKHKTLIPVAFQPLPNIYVSTITYIVIITEMVGLKPKLQQQIPWIILTTLNIPASGDTVPSQIKIN